MKRFFALILAGLLLLGLGACGGNGGTEPETTTGGLADEAAFEPAVFGESDDPPMIALGKVVENGLLTVQRGPDCWRLIAPDESIRLELENYGDIWHLSMALRMEPFFTAGLNEIWWNSGGLSFDKMRASASSFARGHSMDGLCLLSSDWWSKADKGQPLPALLSSLTDQINPDSVAFRQIEGWYGIDLEVYGDDRSGKPRIRFADDGSALEFVLNAGFYREGRLDPAKLQGWEYDAEADTLTKRYSR